LKYQSQRISVAPVLTITVLLGHKYPLDVIPYHCVVPHNNPRTKV
jgi:hypothetical protein